MPAVNLDRTKVVSMVKEAFSEIAGPEGGTPSEETVLLGTGSKLDSISLVTLIVDVEQRVATVYDLSVTLASEAAMSRRSSPFRTIGTLADYVCELARTPEA
jgi:acyl carrier protein